MQSISHKFQKVNPKISRAASVPVSGIAPLKGGLIPIDTGQPRLATGTKTIRYRLGTIRYRALFLR